MTVRLDDSIEIVEIVHQVRIFHAKHKHRQTQRTTPMERVNHRCHLRDQVQFQMHLVEIVQLYQHL